MTYLWVDLILAVLGTIIILSYTRVWGIVVVAVMWAYFAWTLPTYFGYPIDSQMVGTRQALVLNVSKTTDFLYLTVKFTGDEQPRLVAVPNTKDNDDAADNPNQNGGPMIIQFNGTNNVTHVDLNESDQYKK